MPPGTHHDAAHPPGRHDLAALACIVLLAVACRVAALGQPMRYDESVTWALFSGRSWTTIVSWYPFPNNHVLHSLLARATLALSPWSPWALRLPAFVAGVAIVPLTWAVGRRFVDPASALLGAGLAAGSTSLVLYSANARGYSLVVALWLVLLLVGDALRRRTSLPRWVAYGALAAAGLYTVPVMLYPLGAVSLWLAADAWRRPRDERRTRLAALAASLAGAAIVTLLLYLPIIRTAGLGALADNRFVAGSRWGEFAATMPRFLLQALVTWTEPLPWWTAPILLALAIAGLRARRADTGRPSLAVATIAWTALLLLATHRTPFVRVWLWLLPLYLLAVAHGGLRVARRLVRAERAREHVDSPWVSVALAALLCAVALTTRAATRTDDTGAFRGARELTAVIAPRLRAGDRVLAPMPSNGPLLWYFAERGLDTAALNAPLADARRAFLVLDPSRGQTLEWAIGARIIDPRDFAEPRLLGRAAGAEAWEAERVGRQGRMPPTASPGTGPPARGRAGPAR